MIAGVGDVKVAARIERDAPRIVEPARLAAHAAQNFHRLIVRVKNLNAAVAELADELIAAGIDAHVVGITQLALAAAGSPVRAQPFALGRKNLDAMVARIRDVEAIR